MLVPWHSVQENFKIMRIYRIKCCNVKERVKALSQIEVCKRTAKHLVTQHNRKQKIHCEWPANNELSNENILYNTNRLPLVRCVIIFWAWAQKHYIDSEYVIKKNNNNKTNKQTKKKNAQPSILSFTLRWELDDIETKQQ